MPLNDKLAGLLRQFAGNPNLPRSPWQKLLTALAVSVVFAVALMFSVVLFALVLSAGLVGWAWLAWKRRGLRIPRRPGAAPASSGEIIEGVVIREVRGDEDGR